MNLQALADDYYVVFYDQLGGGLSPRVDPGEVTVDSVIAELDAIVDMYGKGEKVNLVGHSWGAMVASMYIGMYPDKVDHVVLAEPGFLTSESGQALFEETQMQMSFDLLKYFLRLKFETLHVDGPDDHAADDYFSYHLNMYQGAGHPQEGYRCDGNPPEYGKSWRNGARAAGDVQNEAVDEQGNIDISFIEGVEQFTGKVLFMAGECQTIIGPEWQSEQMEFFPNAELVVIPDAGHEMFDENPEISVGTARDYLDAPSQ